MKKILNVSLSTFLLLSLTITGIHAEEELPVVTEESIVETVEEEPVIETELPEETELVEMTEVVESNDVVSEVPLSTLETNEEDGEVTDEQLTFDEVSVTSTNVNASNFTTTDDENNEKIDTQETKVVATVNGIEYDSLQSAIDNCENNGIIEVKESSAGEALCIDKEIVLTLNMNGFEYESTNKLDTLMIKSSNVTLNINNGVLKNNSSTGYGIYAYAKDENTGFENININLTGVTINTLDQALGVQGLNSNQNISLKNCTINANDSLGIYYPTKSGILTIENTEITGGSGVVVKGGNVVVKGESVIKAHGPFVDPNKPYEGSGEMEITGNAFYVEGGYAASIDVTIEGGKFESANGMAVVKKHANEDINKEIKVISGLFSTSVDEFVNDNNLSVNNGSNYLVGSKDEVEKFINNSESTVVLTKAPENTELNVQPGKVENETDSPILVGGVTVGVNVTTFEKLKELIENGVTPIEITNDIEVLEPITTNKDIVINGNGHSLIAKYVGTDGNKTIISSTNGKLTINDLTLVDSPKYGAQAYGSGTLELNNVTIDNPGYGGVLINGSEATLNNVNVTNTSKPAVELGMGSGITTTPKLNEDSTVTGGSGIYIDGEQIYKALGQADYAQKELDDLVKKTKEVATKNNVGLTVKEPDGTTEEVVKPVQPSKPEESKKEDKKPAATWDDGGPFTTNAQGDVFDRWGNLIYDAPNYVYSSNGYNLVNTSDF